MKLSVIIPVYNEEKTIGEVLKRVSRIKIVGVSCEIIVVDDGSTDSTESVISNFHSQSGLFPISNFKKIRHKKNLGKGAAVRTGIDNATGDYIVIQDADLEYDSVDIPRLIKPIINGRTKVVYGTRLKRLPHLSGEEKTLRFLIHYFGNRFLSLLTSILYGQWITDMETCYKIFPTKALKTISLNSRSFDFEPEITAKLLKNGYKILEVPITTQPRGYEEGKKLNTVRDGAIALWTLLKYRFID